MQGRRATLAAVVATMTAVCLLPTAQAFEKFVQKIPNGDAVPGVQALGHVNKGKGGGARNQFGRAFQAAGKLWTEAFCNEDTDGDGQTNGQELGDPCCSWRETGNLAYITGISDPGDPTSMANPLIFKYIQCTKSEEAVAAAEQEAKRTKKPKPTVPKTTEPYDFYEDNDDNAAASGSGEKNGTRNTYENEEQGEGSVAASDTSDAHGLHGGGTIATLVGATITAWMLFV